MLLHVSQDNNSQSFLNRKETRLFISSNFFLHNPFFFLLLSSFQFQKYYKNSKNLLNSKNESFCVFSFPCFVSMYFLYNLVFFLLLLSCLTLFCSSSLVSLLDHYIFLCVSFLLYIYCIIFYVFFFVVKILISLFLFFNFQTTRVLLFSVQQGCRKLLMEESLIM